MPINLKDIIIGEKKPIESNLSFTKILRESPDKGESTDIQLGQYGVSNSQYDTNVTPENVKNLEEIRANKQSTWDKAGNGLANLAGRTITSGAEGILNPFIGTFNAIKDGQLSSYYDNPFTRTLEEVDKQIKEQVPFYSSNQEKEAHGFEKLLYGNTLWRDVLDGVGYSLGAIAGGGVYSKVFQGLAKMSAVGKAGEFIDKLHNIENASDKLKYIEGVNTTNKIKDGAQNGIIAGLGAMAESGANARGDKDEFIRNMTNEITKGTRELTEEESKHVQDLADEVGNTSFALNMPIIMLDNWITFGKSVFGNKLTDKLNLKELGEGLVKKDGKYEAIKGIVDKSYGTRKFIEPIISEGFFQEQSQYGITKGTNDYYKKKYYNPEAADFIDSFGEGVYQAYGTKEGWDQGIIGALSGGLMGNATTLITEGTKAYVDPNNYQAAANSLNNLPTKKIYTDLIDKAMRHGNLVKEQKESLDNNDTFSYENAKNDDFINYAFTKISYGKTDDLIKQLEEYKGMSEEEFKSNFGTTIDYNEFTKNKQSITQFIEDKINKVKDVQRAYSIIDERFPDASEGNKERLAYASLTIDNSRQRKNKLGQEVNQVLSGYHPSLGFVEQDPILASNYSTLNTNEKKKYVKALDKSGVLNPMDKDTILEKLDDIDKLEERELQFVKEYKELSKDHVQKANDIVDNEVKKKVNKAVNNPEEKPPIDTKKGKVEKPKPVSSNTVITEKPELNIDNFVYDIINGNIDKSPEAIEFYQNNKEEIEKRLVEERAKPVEVTQSLDDLLKTIKKSIPEETKGIFPTISNSNEIRIEKGLSTEKEILDVLLPMIKKGEDFNKYIKLKKVKSRYDKTINIVLVNLKTPEGIELKLGNIQSPDKIKDEQIKKLYDSLTPEKEYSQEDLQKMGVSFTLSKGEFDYLTEENIEGTLVKDITYPMKGEYIIDTEGEKAIVGSAFKPKDFLETVKNIPKNKDGSSLGRYILVIPEETGNRFVAVYPTKLKAIKEIEPLFKEFQNKALQLKKEPNESKRKELASEFNSSIKSKYYIGLKGQPGTLFSLEVSPDGSIRLVTEIKVGENLVKADKPIYVDNINKEDYTFDNLLRDLNKKLKNVTLTTDSFKVYLAKDATTIPKNKIGENFTTFLTPELVKNRNLKVLFDQEFKQESEVPKEEPKVKTLVSKEVKEQPIESRIKELEEKRKTAKGVEKAKLTKELNKLKKDIGFQDFEEAAEKIGTKTEEVLSQEEISWLKDNLPDFIKIDDISNIKLRLNKLGTTWGAFKDNIIYLNQNAGKGTGYHEGFHAIFRSLLTEDQISLYTKLAKKEMNLSKAELNTKINDIKERHPSLNNQQLEDLVYEEYLADKFADWKVNKGTSTNSIFKSFFKKIQDFFKWLFNIDESLESLFDNIDRGVFKSSIQQENKFTSINKPVYKALPASPKTEIDPITGKEFNTRRFLPSTRSTEIINTFAAKLKRASEIKENKGRPMPEVLLELIDSRIQRMFSEETDNYLESLPEVQKTLLEEKRDDEFWAITEGVEILKEQIFKKINSIKPTEEMDANHDDQGTQLMICDSWTIGGEESLSVIVRDWMEFSTYKKLDEITGSLEDFAIDSKFAYNGLTRGLAGLEESDILPRMIALSEDNDNINGVLQLLLQDTGMTIDEVGKLTEPTKNHNLVRMLIVSFKKYKANQLFSELEPIFGKDGFLDGFETKVYNANTNDPKKIQISSWSEEFEKVKDKKEFLKDTTSEISQLFRSEDTFKSEESIKENTKKIQSLFKQLGIDLSSGYIRYSLYKIIENENILTEKQKTFMDSFIEVVPINPNEVFGVIKNLIDKEIDWYSDEGILGRLSDLAENNAVFDETIGNSSFKNADGETVWDIIHGSYVLEEITRINNEAYRSSLKDDNFIKHNLLLTKYDKFLNTLKINITDGLRDTSKDGTSESKEGKVFGDFTEREYLLNVLAYFAEQKQLKGETHPSTYYVFRQNEASNTAYVAKMPVQELSKNGKANQSAIEQVFDSLFKPEYERISREWKETNKTGSFIPGNIKGFNDSSIGRAFSFTEFNYLEQYLGKDVYETLIESAKNEENIKDREELVKKAIENYLNDSISDFKKKLEENDLIEIDENNNIKYNKLLPSKLVTPYKNHDEALAEVFLNDYIMSSNLNQLMDGDYGKTRKDKVDITKRHKGAMGSGINYGSGNHSISFIKDIDVYVVTTPEDSSLIDIVEVREDKYIGSNGKEYTKDQVSKITTNDAQSYSSIYHKIFSLTRLGKLSDRHRAIYKDILQFTKLDKNGKVVRNWNINKKDQRYLELTNSSSNPDKTVTFGRDIYIKTSETHLLRGFISYVKDQDVPKFIKLTDQLFDLRDTNGSKQSKELIKEIVTLYNPLPGKEYWHNLAQQMDLHGIDQVVTESASKGATLTPIDSEQEGFDLSKSMMEVPNVYKREQMETPTGKSVITDSTQLMQLIDTEQDDNTEVSFKGETITVGKLREIYRNLMSRSRGNAFKTALTYIIEKDSNGKEIFGKSKLDKKVERTINESGSDDFLMELFSTNDIGITKFNWNMLPLIDKAEAIVLAHFSKGVLSQKVNGTKVSLVSSKGVKIVRDDSGKVVLSNTISKNPEKYKDYESSELKYNVKDPETGEIYSECILSERVLTKAGLKIGDTIPKELAFMLGVRIPTDDKHSMIALRVVDILPNYMEGTGLFPDKIVHLSGADFDIDSLYIQTPSYYLQYENNKSTEKTKPIKHGSETNSIDRFEGFKEYLLTDKEFKAVFSELLENDSRYKVMKLEDRSELEKLDFESNESYNEALELYTKELEDIKDKIVLQTMEYFGYPLNHKDYQKYIDNPKKGELNKLVIDNEILEARLGLLTNSHIQKEIAHEKTSTDPFSEEADFIDGIKPIQEGLNVKYRSTSDLVGKFIAFLKNAAGKKGIGPVANSLQLFTLLSKAKARLNTDAYKLTITSKDDTVYTTQKFRNLNTAGERIVGLLGSLLNTMTDNAKDPIAGRMNLKLNLLNTYSMLLMQGLSKRNSTLILNAPIIQEYSKKKETATFGVKTAFEASEKSWQIKNSLYSKYLGKELTEEEIEAEFKDVTFNANQIEELIKGNLSKEESDLLNAQLFYAWLKIEDQADTLSNVNFLLKSNKGLPSSFNELENGFSEAIGELGLSELIGYPTKFENKSPIDMVDIIKGDKHTLTNMKIIKKVLEEAPNLFISQSKGFKEEFNKLLTNLKPGSILKSEVKKSIERDFLGFLSTRAYRNKIKEIIDSKDTNENMKARFTRKLASLNDSLVFPELDSTKQTLARRLSELKGSNNESIRTNAAIRHLNYEFKFSKTPEGILVENKDNKKKRDIVTTRTWAKPSKTLVNDIIDGFKQLYLVPETHDFAVDMFNYLMVTDNMSFRSGSFVKFLAPFMFKELSGGLESLTQELAKEKPDYKKVLGEDIKPLAKEFREIFNRYKPNSDKLIYINPKTVTNIIKEDKLVFTEIKDSEKEYLGKVLKQVKDSKALQFPEYIKYGKEYYKLDQSLNEEGENTIGYSSTYTKTFPFGYRGLSPYYQSLENNLNTYERTFGKTEGKSKVDEIKLPITNKILFEEEQSSGYRERTIKNASADATIALAVDFNSAGEKLTKSSVKGQDKKYIPIDASSLEITQERVGKIVESLNSVNAKSLNIAGNGIYTMKGKYTQEEVDKFTYDLLKEVLESSNLKNKIESIRTGGQTGFDEAGAKAGIKLGIKTLVLAPKGWKFRNVEGIDISSEELFKERFEENNNDITQSDVDNLPDVTEPC